MILTMKRANLGVCVFLKAGSMLIVVGSILPMERGSGLLKTSFLAVVAGCAKVDGLEALQHG